MTIPSLNSQQQSPPRTYEVRTFGCQIGVHDLERLSGLLGKNGYAATAEGENPDLVVSNTCAVRENANDRLYGTLGQLKPVKDVHPGMQIVVDGCLVQEDKDVVVKKAPWVNIIFGTHSLGPLPVLLGRAAHNDRAEVEIKSALEEFPSVLPTKRESTYADWVSISVNHNNTCTSCIVPSLRGKEHGRRPGEILAEVQALVEQGITDATLLGQNVNAYGVNFASLDMGRDRPAFSKLLRACDQIKEPERVRFMPPHPTEFTDDVIDAMAETPNVVHQLHIPLQSGSDRMLKDMCRSHRTKKLLGILDKAREKMPDATITANIIVGFPGETEEDFQAALDVVEKARFNSAFTFQYSPHPGTPTTTMPDQVPPEVMKERCGRLLALQEHISEEENAKLIGREVELLVNQSDDRKSAETHHMSGQNQDGRLMYFSPSEGEPGVVGREIRPDDYVTVYVTDSAPHFLIADSGVLTHRRTEAGDNVGVSQAPTTAPIGVGLGSPKIGRPEKTSVSEGCGCEQ